jgi:hypothetical protein
VRARVTINASFDPAEEVKLYQGWFWDEHQDRSADSAQALLAKFMTVVPTAYRTHRPEPVSTGVFEKRFLDYVAQQVASKVEND